MSDEDKDILRRIELLDLRHRFHGCIPIQEERAARYREKWLARISLHRQLL